MSNMPPPPPAPPPNYGGPPQPPMGYTPYGAAPMQQNLAGFGSRLGGRILDTILYGLVGAVFGIPAWFFFAKSFDDCLRIRNGNTTEISCTGDQFKAGQFGIGMAIAAVGFLVVAFLYLSHLAKSGQTWGRKIAGIKVVTVGTNDAPGWGKAIGRTLLAQTISQWVCLLGYLWMLWDPQKQTWHDKMVGTVVISV